MTKVTDMTLAVPISTYVGYFVQDPRGTPVSKKFAFSALTGASGTSYLTAGSGLGAQYIREQRTACPGYSFNLDGTNIYLTMASLFVAQALNIDLTLKQQQTILGVAMLTSKGASGVAGGASVSGTKSLVVASACELPLPSAAFSVNTTTPRPGGTVSFTDLSTGERLVCWRVLAAVLGRPLTEMDYAAKQAAVKAAGIAIWDVYRACMRDGSLDSAIRSARPNDFSDLGRLAPQLRETLLPGSNSRSRGSRRVGASP